MRTFYNSEQRKIARSIWDLKGKIKRCDGLHREKLEKRLEVLQEQLSFSLRASDGWFGVKRFKQKTSFNDYV